MTELEKKLYLALLGARPYVEAASKLQPRTARVLHLVDSVMKDYKAQQDKEEPADGAGDGS